jgi:hypothetical protein
METACECLQASTDPAAAAKLTKDTVAVKACKCSMLENYVTECMANDESVQLDTWRSAEQCGNYRICTITSFDNLAVIDI